MEGLENRCREGTRRKRKCKSGRSPSRSGLCIRGRMEFSVDIAVIYHHRKRQNHNSRHPYPCCHLHPYLYRHHLHCCYDNIVITTSLVNTSIIPASVNTIISLTASLSAAPSH